ncbi:MAG: hypothetical protein IJX40_01620 [Alistipes sp.]|nr:hypothetical protein [Alistipes sp.]
MTQEERIVGINKILKEHFKTNKGKVEAQSLMPLFVDAGIFDKKYRYSGKKLRTFLRGLRDKNELWKIPYIQAEKKQKNTFWYFAPSSKTIPAKLTMPVVANKVPHEEACCTSIREVENRLIRGQYTSVNSLVSTSIPQRAGLYCIKLRKGVTLPTKIGKVREDGIIYIGKGVNLYKRLWQNELNSKGHATFFRSMGAILGYIPPKGSLKSGNNYHFDDNDTERIIKWMRQSLTVNYIVLDDASLSSVEKQLITKYMPLVNIQHNPNASEELRRLRSECVRHAQ